MSLQEKCMQYWAEEKDLTFGAIKVKPGHVETTTDYDIRHLSISKVRCFFPITFNGKKHLIIVESFLP